MKLCEAIVGHSEYALKTLHVYCCCSHRLTGHRLIPIIIVVRIDGKTREWSRDAYVCSYATLMQRPHRRHLRWQTAMKFVSGATIRRRLSVKLHPTHKQTNGQLHLRQIRSVTPSGRIIQKLLRGG